jgi:pilus assembly protein CpaC
MFLLDSFPLTHIARWMPLVLSALGTPTVQAQSAPPPAAKVGGVVEAIAGAAAPAKPKAAAVRIEQGSMPVLAVGDVHTLPLPGVTRIALGNGAMARATVVDDREIVLLAEQAGRTTMHVWLRNGRQLSYEVQVIAQRPGKLLGDLQDMLKGLPGLQARMLGERIALEGRYQNREVALKIRRLTESFPQLLNLVPDQPLDADPLQLERMVQIDLRVIEVKRRALEQLGIKWGDTAAGPTFATNALIYSNTPLRPPELQGFAPVNTANPIRSVLGMASTLTSALRFLESRGDAWVLAEPRLSCRSGGEASFLAGGEIPIPVAQGNGAVGVQYKEYGVRIEFKPLADAEHNVDSAIMVEVSEPDSRNSNGGFIAFATNRTETRVAMKAGEPLVMSGLLRQRFEDGTDAVPGLGRLPLLGALFKSRGRTSEKTELFVIATPRVINPGDAAQQEVLKRADEAAQRGAEQAAERLNPKPLLPEATSKLDGRDDKDSPPLEELR